MPSQNAVYVRDVGPTEATDELARDAKALTWEHWCEHAVLEIEGGRRILVRGGRYGIDLEIIPPLMADPFGRPKGSIWVEANDGTLRVVGLILHTHPKPTGPSDDDLRLLELLGQKQSLLFEVFGPPDGTVIRPKATGMRRPAGDTDD